MSLKKVIIGDAVLYLGDCLDVMAELPEQSVNCCVTSPPYYGLRDYGCAGQIGLEETPNQYVEKMVEVFRGVRRILRDDGTVWLNLGDSYSRQGGATDNKNKSRELAHMEGHQRRMNKVVPGLKQKDLIGIPWRVALALQADGWYLRQDIIWHKPNPMPESVTDRCTKAHEYIFLLSRSAKYYYDHKAIKEPAAQSSIDRWNQDVDNQTGSDRQPGKVNGTMKAVGGNRKLARDKNSKSPTGNLPGRDDQGRACNKPDQVDRNKRSVWTVSTKPYKEAHFAVFPPDLIEPCILAGCPEGGTVFDPFSGSGTTGEVATMNNRHYIGSELNSEYVDISVKRLTEAQRQLRLFT